MRNSVFEGKCPRCGFHWGHHLENDLYSYDDIIKLGPCPHCEWAVALCVIDDPDNPSGEEVPQELDANRTDNS